MQSRKTVYGDCKPDMSLLRLLLEKRHLFGYGEMRGSQLSNAFIFRNPCTRYKDKMVGDCVISIWSKPEEDQSNIWAFQRAAKRFMGKAGCELLLLEELGDGVKLWTTMKTLGLQPLTTCPCLLHTIMQHTQCKRTNADASLIFILHTYLPERRNQGQDDEYS